MLDGIPLFFHFLFFLHRKVDLLFLLQLVTVAVLLYSTFAAIYYARYNYLMNLESGNYDDPLFARSLSTFQNRFTRLDSQTFQRIVDAIFGTDEHEFGVQLRD